MNIKELPFLPGITAAENQYRRKLRSYLKGLGYDTVIFDLDIVNPYFRTKDSMRSYIRPASGLYRPLMLIQPWMFRNAGGAVFR